MDIDNSTATEQRSAISLKNKNGDSMAGKNREFIYGGNRPN